jgi:tetratricopeptide (TPR) repeat protein
MKKIIPFLIMAALTSGFTWGKSAVDKCDEAKTLAFGLTSTTDRGSRIEAEASIRQLCPDGVADLFIRGYAYEVAGNLEKAVLLYREALRQDPEFAPANGRVGLILLENRREDEAAIELTKAMKVHSDPLYNKGLARIFTSRKLNSLAIYHFQEAIKSFPADASLFTGLAQVYKESGDFPKAEEAYRRAITLSSGNRDSLTGLAALYTASNQYDKAIDLLKKAEVITPLDKEIHRQLAEVYLKKGDVANADSESLLAGIQPKKPEIRTGAGDRFFAAKEYGKAVEAYRIEIGGDPENGDLFRRLGHALMLAGRDDDAISAYKEAMRLKADSQEVNYNLGVLYEKKGLHDEAVVEYKKALKSGESVDVRYRLADIYARRGSSQQAVDQYKILLNSNPSGQLLLQKLANIYAAAGHQKEAIATYREIVRLNPDHLEAHRELATLYKKTNLQDEAEREYREILRLKKDDMEVRGALTSIYVKKKSYPELIALLKGNLELAPNDSNQYYRLGLVYEFQKDYENASVSYAEAIKSKEDNAKALNALGRIKMKTGNIKEAKEYLEKAKAADPNMEEATLLLSNIRDELAPDPSKYKKSKKGKKSKKSKTSKKKGTVKKSSTKKSSSTTKKPAAKAASGSGQ